MLCFHPVVDVSAQGGCIVTPINPTTLTTAGGTLPTGTENVMMNCNCTNDDGTVVDIVRWYDPSGTRLTMGGFVPGTPHIVSADELSNINIILAIPTFNDSYNGTYTCGMRADDGTLGTPSTTVTLTISELMVNAISYQYIAL